MFWLDQDIQPLSLDSVLGLDPGIKSGNDN